MNPAFPFFDFALFGNLCALPAEPAPVRRPSPARKRPPREPTGRPPASAGNRRSRRKAA